MGNRVNIKEDFSDFYFFSTIVENDKKWVFSDPVHLLLYSPSSSLPLGGFGEDDYELLLHF